MSIINIRSYAKINLSLDILGTLPGGYHQVAMVLQQIDLYDEVAVRFTQGKENRITVNTNKPYIPKDQRNIAYKAAELMRERYGSFSSVGREERRGEIRVDIKKNIPVSAGLAGGSGNGGAVLMGINRLWKLGLSLEELCSLGEELGSDVVFTLCGMAYSNGSIGLEKDPLACCCALAEGTGTILTRLPPVDAFVVLSKPPISVSTGEAYGGIDDELKGIERKGSKDAVDAGMVRPNNEELIRGLEEGSWSKIKKNMANVLELYTLKRYDKVVYTKNKVKHESGENPVLMSGSGPTIYALFKNKEDAEAVFRTMKEVNKETYLAKTTV